MSQDKISYQFEIVVAELQTLRYETRTHQHFGSEILGVWVLFLVCELAVRGSDVIMIFIIIGIAIVIVLKRQY